MKFIGGEDMTEAERDRLADEDRRRRIMRYALTGRSKLINELRRKGCRANMTWEQLAEIGRGSAYDIAVALVDIEDRTAGEPGDGTDHPGHVQGDGSDRRDEPPVSG